LGADKRIGTRGDDTEVLLCERNSDSKKSIQKAVDLNKSCLYSPTGVGDDEPGDIGSLLYGVLTQRFSGAS
jgi:hypothetical protein